MEALLLDPGLAVKAGASLIATHARITGQGAVVSGRASSLRVAYNIGVQADSWHHPPAFFPLTLLV
jgi:hypothetical protein